MNKIQLEPYPPIPDIISRFVSLQEQYPPLYLTDTDYPTVKAWLKILRNKGYDDGMMKEILGYIFKLIDKEKYEEATLLLLVSAASDDNDANHLLARELFKGILFKENRAASFGILKYLSEKDHAKAMYDIAPFYKNGIIVNIDKKYALLLYEKAMKAGIKRAEEKYLELKKSTFSLF